MVKMKVLVMVVMMMIPMKSSSMTVAMATISPLQEGISSADFCLPESFLSLCVCVFRPAEAVESISDPSVLGFQGPQYTRGGAGRSRPGGHTTGWRGQGLAHATWWCGPPAAPLALSFWLLLSFDKI
jgi:hypothetical protein